MKELEYIIPIQSEEECNKINKSLGTDFKSTEWHLEDLLNKVYELVKSCGDDGGWYTNDAIKVKLSVEYNPEDK